MAGLDLFISHSSGDAEVARELRALLEGAGYTCWMAPDDVTGSDPWAEQILAAIQGSRAMLVLVSSHSNRSPHVAREVGLATGRDRPVLPVRVEAVTPEGALEYHLAGLQRMDAFPPPISGHSERILRRLALVLPTVPAAPLPPPGPVSIAGPAGPIAPVIPVIPLEPMRAAETPPAPPRGRISGWARANSMLAGALVTLAALVIVATGVLAFGRPSTSESPGPSGSQGAVDPGSSESTVPNTDGPTPASTGSSSTFLPTASPAPNPTPTPTPGPTHDNKPPTGVSVTISKNTVYLPKVNLDLRATGASEMRLGIAGSSTGACSFGAWTAFRQDVNSYGVSSGQGGKRWVCAEFRDASGNSAGDRDSVYFDNLPVGNSGVEFNPSFCTGTHHLDLLDDPPYVATDPDAGDTLSLIRVWTGGSTYPGTKNLSDGIQPNGTHVDIDITYSGPATTVKDWFTVEDEHGGRASGYFEINLPAC